jgi:hypothetical protein
MILSEHRLLASRLERRIEGFDEPRIPTVDITMKRSAADG